MTTTAPLHIERDGLWAVLTNARQYRAALQSVGAKWRADGTWRLPLTVANLNTLQRAGVPLESYEPDISADPFLVPSREVPARPTTHLNWTKLYEYQKDAVSFLLYNPYPGALLALSPGLGKTPTSIVAAEMLDAKNVLTICPKVLIGVWRQERERWATLPWNDSRQEHLRIWQVANWEWILYHPEEFTNHDWDLVILDESVLVKTRSTKRFQLAKKLRKRAERMWLLSGSPVTRFVDDLWTQLHLCFPDAFTSYWRFCDTYCFTEETPWTAKAVVGSRPFATSDEWKDLMFVKNQAEVLPDLPDFVEQNIPVELSGQQKKLYDRALQEFLVTLEGEELPITTKVAQLVRLQQLVSHPANCDTSYKGNVGKLEALLELVESKAIETPLLIWTYHRQTARAVDAGLSLVGLRSAYAIGGMADQSTEALLRDFKTGHLDALVLSLGVGKYGLSFQHVKTVVYYDKTWSADEWVQSLSRVKRIGLDHMFHIINLHSPHTTDDMIVGNLAEKAESIARVSNADLASLLRAL